MRAQLELIGLVLGPATILVLGITVGEAVLGYLDRRKTWREIDRRGAHDAHPSHRQRIFDQDEEVTLR